MAMKRTRIRKSLFVYALLITLFLLATILLLSGVMGEKREDHINNEMQRMYNSLNEMQTFLLMSEIYGSDMACITFESKLRELDRTVWDLGRKIDQYRVASEEFLEDPYYLEQKRFFNENELFYLMLLTKLKRECGFDQAVVSFFYQNSAECWKCDDQSFILADINREIDEEVSIFSFDTDLGLSSLDALAEFYNITEYPCLVIDEQLHCGIKDRDFIYARFCETNPNLSVC